MSQPRTYQSIKGVDLSADTARRVAEIVDVIFIPHLSHSLTSTPSLASKVDFLIAMLRSLSPDQWLAAAEKVKAGTADIPVPGQTHPLKGDF